MVHRAGANERLRRHPARATRREPDGGWRQEPDNRLMLPNGPYLSPWAPEFVASSQSWAPDSSMDPMGQYQHEHNSRHFQQQVVQQQIHQSGFCPTLPNYGQPYQIPRKPPVVPAGLGLPTPPRTQSPPRKHKRPPPTKFQSCDTIIPPSAASGGVPDPSPAYLLRASFLPRKLPQPQPLLVIIDLNGTLLHRPSGRNPTKFVARPFAEKFLNYCLDTFHVMVWSSARPHNVSAMCAKLLSPPQLGRLVAVWGRDRFGLSTADYNSRVQCYKRLSRVWGDPAVRASYPADYDDSGRKVDEAATDDWKPGSWNQGNTVLIDDSKEKARSDPYNAIEIPEFLGNENEDTAILPEVHDYLNTLAYQADVSTYIRANPFTPKGKD